jgi:2-haloacid dehalogenase
MPGREDEMEAILADVLNHEWNLARDRGASWQDAMNVAAEENPQWADIFATFTERWPETLGGSHEDTVAILRELDERGVPLYALSNWSAEMFPHAEARFDWLRCFDGVVVSGRVRMVKPEPAIFRHLLETYELQPGDVFFIDDHEPNVLAARELGIYAHHFRDPGELRADLEAHGLLERAAA